MSAQSAEATVVVDGPMTVHAIWKEDYTQALIVLAALGCIIGLALFGLFRHTKGGGESGLKQILKAAGPAKEETKPEARASARIEEILMKEISAETDRERYLKKLEELRANGRISQRIYEKLKKKLES